MQTRASLYEIFSTKDFFESIVGRPEIQLLTNESIQKEFSTKRVLITGAGGTIGSAVAKRLADAEVDSVFYFDRDESALHALALRLSDTAASHSNNCLVGDIRDANGLTNLFEEILPDVVIHTAALKHLVVLERFPREGLLTNVIGTRNVLNAARTVGTRQVLNVSTDKAALPSSTLGKTKLIAEHITNENCTTEMLTSSVRFGNVFASRGSVIETFIHQIKNALPVTITDPEVTRFFMSQNEAANLILSTCAMKDKGVFVQEMGTRIKITSIVNKLAEHLGLEPRIDYIGLQKGEKLHEDLYEKEFELTANSAIVKLPQAIQFGILEQLDQLSIPADDKEALAQLELFMSLITSK